LVRVGDGAGGEVVGVGDGAGESVDHVGRGVGEYVEPPPPRVAVGAGAPDPDALALALAELLALGEPDPWPAPAGDAPPGDESVVRVPPLELTQIASQPPAACTAAYPVKMPAVTASSTREAITAAFRRPPGAAPGYAVSAGTEAGSSSVRRSNRLIPTSPPSSRSDVESRKSGTNSSVDSDGSRSPTRRLPEAEPTQQPEPIQSDVFSPLRTRRRQCFR
jgi:hypothetical protein